MGISQYVILHFCRVVACSLQAMQIYFLLASTIFRDLNLFHSFFSYMVLPGYYQVAYADQGTISDCDKGILLIATGGECSHLTVNVVCMDLDPLTSIFH